MIEIQSQKILEAAVAHKPEIRWQNHDNGTTVVAYMISAPDTFDSMLARECRGIVFYDNKVVGRPFHKFFNVNEKSETQLSVLDWSKLTRITDKRDGSMINTVAVPSLQHGTNFCVKSKKTFNSRFAVAAMDWIMERPNYVDFCAGCAANGLTAIFEWTTPDNRIVISYEKPELQLLHVRENVSGRYLSKDELQTIAYDITMPQSYPVASIQDILKSAETVEGIEGWVFQFNDGEMVKLKTRWYLDRHYAMTALRTRDVAELVLTEAIDDLKSKLVTSGVDINPILAIEQRVVYLVNTINDGVECLYRQVAGMSRKDVALKYNSHPWFGLLMKRMSGVEPETKKFVQKNLLQSEFDLQPVY